MHDPGWQARAAHAAVLRPDDPVFGAERERPDHDIEFGGHGERDTNPVWIRF